MAPGLMADWALWGKEPHTNSGYKVLAACPPDRSAHYNSDIHHWSPGTPAPGDQLPCITIGPCTAPDGTDTVGVFLLEGTDAVDRTYRPICRINHFAVPTADVQAHALGWCALARAALEAVPRLTASGAAPAELPVAEDGTLLGAVSRFVTPHVSEGSRWLAAAAAYLLDGKVVVTGERHYKPLELLVVLDCVAAMLPYGMRSTLSAATWTSSGSEVRMRLYWGVADEAPGLTSLAWGGELPDIGGLSPEARSYHDLLIRAWTVYGGDVVVGYLAGARDPLDITGPSAHADALRVLAGLDPALAVEQELREGREVENDRIVAALGHPGAHPGSVTYLSETRIDGPSTDMGPVAPHLRYHQVSQVFREKMVADLLNGRTDRALSRFRTVREATSVTKEDLDPLDQVLAFVIDEAGRLSAVDTPDPVVEQLLPYVAPFTVGTMAFTQSLLRKTEGLAGRLVHALCARPDPAPSVLAWLRWLGDGSAPRAEGSPELPLLYDLLGDGSGTAGASRKWVDAHPGAAARLLAAVAACGRADRVLQDDFFQGLVGCASRGHPSDPPEGQSAAPLIRALERPPDRMRPQTAARWDVLCTLTGLLPRGFFTLARAPEQPPSGGLTVRLDGYTSTLNAELAGHAVRPHAPLVVRRLLEAVLMVDPDTGEGPDQAGRELTIRLLERPGPHLPIVEEAVKRLTEQSLWHDRDSDEQWLKRLSGRLPRLTPILVLRAVHRTARRAGDTPVDRRELAERLYAARCAGFGHEQLRAPLCSWAVREHPGARILGILTAYHKICEFHAGPDRAFEERRELELAFARGGPEGTVWQHYRDHMISRLKQERAEFAREIQESMRKQALTDKEIDRLRSLDAETSHARR